MTRAHKNHLGLLEALALLRDRDGLELSLVCTGFQNEFFPTIEERLNALALRDQVKFLGLVPVDGIAGALSIGRVRRISNTVRRSRHARAGSVAGLRRGYMFTRDISAGSGRRCGAFLQSAIRRIDRSRAVSNAHGRFIA
jgi:hypothetical protein